uniref:KORA domain-containing protein n=1 Tax=Haemonchus contortus TaxID=6289 RepID=A0A7I4YDN9_HAECO
MERTKILMRLPHSFREVSNAFLENPGVERRLYGTLNDIGRLLGKSAARISVMVRLATDELILKRQWCKHAASFATAPRVGIKVIAVTPPQIDNSYARNKSDMTVIMKQSSRCLIRSVESPQEPSHGPGAQPIKFSAEAYFKEIIQEH